MCVDKVQNKPSLYDVKRYIESNGLKLIVVDLDKFYYNVILKSPTDWRKLLAIFSEKETGAS